MCVLRVFPDEFEKYCSDMEHTAAWGGQLEVSCSGFFVTDTLWRLILLLLFSSRFHSYFSQLRALTQALHVPIEVIQANSATIKIGEEFDSEPITLVYVTHISICMLGIEVVVAQSVPYMR